MFVSNFVIENDASIIVRFLSWIDHLIKIDLKFLLGFGQTLGLFDSMLNNVDKGALMFEPSSDQVAFYHNAFTSLHSWISLTYLFQVPAGRFQRSQSSRLEAVLHSRIFAVATSNLVRSRPRRFKPGWSPRPGQRLPPSGLRAWAKFEQIFAVGQFRTQRQNSEAKDPFDFSEADDDPCQANGEDLVRVCPKKLGLRQVKSSFQRVQQTCSFLNSSGMIFSLPIKF